MKSLRIAVSNHFPDIRKMIKVLPKTEGLTHTSVGQRPTSRQCNVIKAESLAHDAARRDAVALPCAECGHTLSQG